MPHHVHDAELHVGLPEYSCDGVRKAHQPVNGSNQDFVNTPVFQFSHNAEAERCVFVLRNPQVWQFSLAFHRNVEGFRETSTSESSSHCIAVIESLCSTTMP